MRFPDHILRIAQDPSHADDDHVHVLGDDRWYRVGEVRQHLTDAPDPWAAPLAELRARMAPTFEDTYKRERFAAIEVTRQALDADQPARLTTAELQPYLAPDGYAEALRKLRSH